MTCNFFRFAMTAGVVCATTAAAWAQPTTPYSVSVTPEPTFIDRTLDYSGNAQASTMTVANVPGGLRLDIVWSTGASFVNEDFTRVVPIFRFPGDTGDGDGGDLGAFDGVEWTLEVLSGPGLTLKPMTQPYTFTFYEGNQAGQNGAGGAGEFGLPADSSSHVSWIDWDDVTGGPVPAADRDNMFEIGFQLYGPAIAQDSGETVMSSVLIHGVSIVPEPTSLLLGSLGLAMVGMFRRRR